MDRYIPKQGDLVWIDFDPSKGKEIGKYRPAVVLSRNEYNHHLNYVIVSPIGSTFRKNPQYYTLVGYQTTGQISTHQLYSLDYEEKAGRKIKYIESMREEDFLQVAQLVNYNFNFNV